ncbi:FimD/PapC N-terminal domain-containing protein [Pseudomonas zeae]|uniref:FimD/PapC N-terminal domain-containing protein n=1 Tax=Pseudomonas zeae TaxID=2745510 RepID=A0ABU5BQ66_9PSED|nr:FimD/PapC N-terminal domain-containing protein [Pseudomonas zeae]MDX9678843.1 FimD/PapC N-terminal domain-containing protein [Pseudomonas zeae]
MEFNSEFLNIDKNDDISLGQFAHAQYTVPGRYLLDITVNQRYFGSRSIEFKSGANPQESYACLPEDLVATFGLKPALLKSLPRLAEGQCVDLRGIEKCPRSGYMKNLRRLSISLPQAPFEYGRSQLQIRLPPGATGSTARCLITE